MLCWQNTGECEQKNIETGPDNTVHQSTSDEIEEELVQPINDVTDSISQTSSQ